jgi:hypothetical protein
MAEVAAFPNGGYRFIPGPFQYSGGVCADPGFEIERVRLREWLPLEAGFPAIRGHLERLGRPLTALCACELRSPAPFTPEGFTGFNREYIKTLEQWGLYRDGINPIARSNVCPEAAPPSRPSFYAFSYTVPIENRRTPSFVISGSGEVREGPAIDLSATVRRGDRSPEGMRAKATFVLDEMERRLSAFGLGWGDVTGAHTYTVYDIHPLLKDLLAARGAMRCGLSWHFARPPLVDLDYEMDVRGVATERVV